MLQEVLDLKSPKMKISAILAIKKFPGKSEDILDIFSLKSEMEEKLKKHESSMVGLDYDTIAIIFRKMSKIVLQFGSMHDNLLADFLLTHKRFVKKRKERLELFQLEYPESELFIEQVLDLEAKLESLGVDPKKLLRFETSKHELGKNLTKQCNELCYSLQDDSDKSLLQQYLGN